MTNNEAHIKTLLINALGIGVFLIGGVIAIVSFTSSGIDVIQKISGRADVVIIQKGLFYMLGAGIGLLCVGIDQYYNRILHKKLTNIFLKIFTVFFFGGIVIALLLPHILSSVATNKLEKLHYSYCAPLSYTWLFYKDIAYVKDKSLCVTEDEVYKR